MIKKACGALTGILCLFCFSNRITNATVTETWDVDSYTAFDKGDADAAVVSSLGEVRPGWSSSGVELKFDNAWSTILGPRGVLYVGSDKDATIYQVSNTKVTKLAKIGQAVAVVSLALDSNGTLFAGTMPDGEIWTVDTKTGTTKKLVTLSDTETVWSLALTNDRLYAGTGPNGLLYRVNTSNGQTKIAFDTEDKRIMSLLVTGDNALWFGTSSQALVFRHDLKTKKTRAIADFAGNEVSALAQWRGSVIVAANKFDPGPSSGFKTKEAVDEAKKKPAGHKAKMPKQGSKPGAEPKSNADIQPQPQSLRKGNGALYRLQGDGQLTQLHALPASYFTSIAVNKKGQIFAGAADNGRIYLVDNDESVSTAIDVEQRYIANVLIDKNDKIRFTTGDAARAYRSSTGTTKSSYTSEVFDAKAPALFGRLVWHSTGKLIMETRTGNIQEPGIGWSRWRAPDDILRGAASITRGTVSSPMGRYFQYRTRFSADRNAVLSKTSLFYLPANTATQITEVSLKSDDQKPGRLTQTSPKPRKAELSLEWKVNNKDGDKTEYKLSIRREGDLRWHPLNTGPSPLTETEFVWATETTADGYYRVKVEANDHLANARTRSLKHSWTTPLVAVDNQRPRLTGISIRYPAASVKASDAMSTISEMAYSIDDGEWVTDVPSDGIFDDQTEIFKIKLPSKLATGSHSFALRVSDREGNIASSSRSFLVP